MVSTEAFLSFKSSLQGPAHTPPLKCDLLGMMGRGIPERRAELFLSLNLSIFQARGTLVFYAHSHAGAVHTHTYTPALLEHENPALGYVLHWPFPLSQKEAVVI